MPDIFTGVLDVDNTAPVVSSLFPVPASTGVPVSTTVSFDITDAGAGVDLTSLDIIIAAQPAIVNGLFAPGFSGSISAISGGYSVSITIGSAFSYNETVVISYYVQDLAAIFNATSGSWSFTIEDDTTAPVIDGLTPADGATSVAVTTSVSFDATDPDSGVSPGSLNLTIGGISALINGVTQPGFSVSILAIPNGYHVEAQPDIPFASLDTIESTASASNNSSVPLVTTVTWSFQTSDAEAPLITPVYPASGEVGVSTGSTVIFNVTDNVGVNTSLLNVTYGSTPVIVNGVFQTNYAGGITPTPDSTNVVVSIVSIIPFSSYEVVTITVEAEDASGNSSYQTWGFQCIDTIAPVIDNELPSPGSTGVPNNTSIYFRVKDSQSGVATSTVSAVVEGAPAISAGVFHPGFSGSIDPLPLGDGYEVQIQSAATYGSYHTIDVDASASDLDGNSVSASWSFRIQDYVHPSLSNISPADGSTGIETTTSVSFDVKDFDSGINASSIQLVIDGYAAVLNGAVQPEFTGAVNPITDGFSVSVTKNAPFYGLYNVVVSASAQDNEGNTTTVPWSFTTKTVISYLMRAWYSGTNEFVYWLTNDVYAAFADAPYPESELSDLVLSEVIDTGASLGVMIAMRAYRSISSEFVYWPSDTPDTSNAPYPGSELSDLVVVFKLPSDFVDQPVLLLENGGIIMQENNGYIIVT